MPAGCSGIWGQPWCLTRQFSVTCSWSTPAATGMPSPPSASPMPPTRGGLSLLLYDVTTLYFEAEFEDELRKVGYSKERRIDPQIVVGLLVDRTGFPLEIGCYEGNNAETTTIAPIITSFLQSHP